MEQIEDIIGDIRAQNQGLPEDGYALSPLVSDLLGLADRIEAAVKPLIADRDNWRKQALAEDARANETQSVANAAEMRKALERLREWVLMDLNENAFIADSSGNYMKLIKGTIEIANAALSAPPRNCDLYTTEDEAYQAYKKEMEYTPEKAYLDYEDWLFAEAKGENK